MAPMYVICVMLFVTTKSNRESVKLPDVALNNLPKVLHNRREHKKQPNNVLVSNKITKKNDSNY